MARVAQRLHGRTYLQLVDLKQPTGQELAAEIQAQQAAFVYVHDQSCSLTSDQIPNLQGMAVPSWLSANHGVDVFWLFP